MDKGGNRVTSKIKPGTGMKKLPTGMIITGEFIAFTIVFALLHSQTNNLIELSLAIKTGLLIVALLAAVLFTIVHNGELQDNTIKLLEESLSVKDSEYLNIQAQFDEAIEKRTFELQMVNGTLNREIAERIQAEEEIRELQKQLRLILDCAGEGILGLDNHGKVIFINQAALLMLGWETDELLGNTHHNLIHHTHPDGTPHPGENCPIYMAYRDGQVHYKTGDVFWCKNGTSFPVEYVSTPIRDRGILTGAVVVFRDMNTYK